MPFPATPAGMDDAWFRRRYEADAANKARQSWKEHHEWVRVFYEGKRLPPVPGWRARQEEILRRIPPAEHARLRPRLDATGALLASEWAKDNGVRKVSTHDLQHWGRRFSDAARDPAALDAALHEVHAELEKRGVPAAHAP